MFFGGCIIPSVNIPDAHACSNSAKHANCHSSKKPEPRRAVLFCSGELMVQTTLHPRKLTRPNSFNKNGQQKMLQQTAAKQLVTLRRNRTHWFHLTSASAYGRSGHA